MSFILLKPLLYSQNNTINKQTKIKFLSINSLNNLCPCWCYHQQIKVVDCKALKNQIHVAFHYNVSQSNIYNLYQLRKV